jgi:hypothetical protein
MVETDKNFNKSVLDYMAIDKEISFPVKDKLFNSVHKKVERVSAAVYLVSALVSAEEPLRVSLREHVLYTLSLRKEGVYQPIELLFALEKLHGLLKIGSVSGVISVRNVGLLTKEIGELSIFLETLDSTDEDVPSRLLNVKLRSEGGAQIPQSMSKGHVKKVSIKDTSVDLKDINISKGHVVAKKKSVNINQISRQNREKTVLNVLKDKGQISIKDISKVIKECSEKTIQRSLNALIKQKLVEKSGSRRWSVYSVKKENLNQDSVEEEKV